MCLLFQTLCTAQVQRPGLYSQSWKSLSLQLKTCLRYSPPTPPPTPSVSSRDQYHHTPRRFTHTRLPALPHRRAGQWPGSRPADGLFVKERSTRRSLVSTASAPILPPGHVVLMTGQSIAVRPRCRPIKLTSPIDTSNRRGRGGVQL